MEPVLTIVLVIGVAIGCQFWETKIEEKKFKK